MQCSPIPLLTWKMTPLHVGTSYLHPRFQVLQQGKCLRYPPRARGRGHWNHNLRGRREGCTSFEPPLAGGHPLYKSQTGNIWELIDYDPILKPRISKDRIVNTFGRHLLDLSVAQNLLIANGRLGKDKGGIFTCCTHKGSSVAFTI